ncbi:MAG TPA: malto-oligosyltrehalose trehalohydrolase [Isosphaeraceae bacterium]|nr:malto-oligosyltrehalose trehalohydrolase [Isosphaeraceae bacterium]
MVGKNGNPGVRERPSTQTVGNWDWPTGWQPSLGAWPDQGGTRFRVWAPEMSRLEVVIEGAERQAFPMEKYQDGTFGIRLDHVGPGTRYRYRIEEGGEFPDPASRYQPEGVHGPSAVVDPTRFAWSDEGWVGVIHEDLVLYEMHTGTFTPEGTFQAAAERLKHLVALGVTAVELMPVSDFPGSRNWGYDGVDLFAPARCYGTPDDLRRLVDEAHRLGLAVFLDVVYNHLGPEGNYLEVYSPYYFSTKHENPWGRGVNVDGPHGEMVRSFFIENALHWIHEYHIDGLRLDATHAIVDDRSRHFVTELTTRVRESVHGRRVYVIAEDHRNLAYMVKGEGEGGWGLNGVWADDFHHKVRVALAGDNEGYYSDYSGSMSDLAVILNDGWHFKGQYSPYLGVHKGTDPTGIPPRRFVFCLQNHDQIGNRALGERLHHQIDLAAFRAASVLMLCAPATPLIFMGQEWATTAPFQFFTDHPKELGKLVTEGRRKEFRHFRMFADPESREKIPDPQSPSTFEASRLRWEELEQEPHGSVYRLYRALLALRKSEPALQNAAPGSFVAFAVSDSTLLLRQDSEMGPSLLAVIQMQGPNEVSLEGHPSLEGLDGARCQVVLTTEDPPFSPEPQAPEIDLKNREPRIRFARPSAVLLRAWRREPIV